MDDAKRNENDWLETFSSPAQVEAALREKAKGSLGATPSKGERLKEYPKPQRGLDLHGMTSSEAERAAESFIRSATDQRLRTVKLITGKGLHSKDGRSVLRGAIDDLLLSLKRSGMVLEFKWERDGGGVVVYLY